MVFDDSGDGFLDLVIATYQNGDSSQSWFCVTVEDLVDVFVEAGLLSGVHASEEYERRRRRRRQ